MRDLMEMAIECMDMLDGIGIQYGNLLDITPNTRARRRWGQCKSVPGGFTININADLLDERNDINGLKDTILHELLHTVSGCMNHGEKWKRLAEMVNKKYGMHISRTNSAEDKGVTYRRDPYWHYEVTYRVNNNVYLIKCQCCGHTYKRMKKSKVVQHPELFRCGRCNGKLERIA